MSFSAEQSLRPRSGEGSPVRLPHVDDLEKEDNLYELFGIADAGAKLYVLSTVAGQRNRQSEELLEESALEESEMEGLGLGRRAKTC